MNLIKQHDRLFGFLLLFAGLGYSGCKEIEYTVIDDPAYLRVFNNLPFGVEVQHQDELYPMFTMLVEPEFDAGGALVGAGIVGDYLDRRDPYAPPYPVHIGNSTNPYNPEYPGKARVLVGPILNGFDLSSWAQIPSGKQRVMFVYRPKTEVPFFALEKRERQRVLVDTVLDLAAGEVYTLHLLQKDFRAKRNGMLLRREKFHKLPLADSLTYVNFYNMSAAGFVKADLQTKASYPGEGMFVYGVRDTMAVHMTLAEPNPARPDDYQYDLVLPYYDRVYLGTMLRDTEHADVQPYVAFPTFPRSEEDSLYTNVAQYFYFRHPSLQIYPTLPSFSWGEFVRYGASGRYAYLVCRGPARASYEKNNNPGGFRPNLLVNTHSGIHNPRTFSTVNTIEVVNGTVYLTTVQRVYDPPIYRQN